MSAHLPSDFLNGSVFNLTGCNNSSDSDYRLVYIIEFARIIYAMLFFVGLCGNSVVIYVILRFSEMQTMTNVCILNLALADEILLVGLPFLSIFLTLGYWPFFRGMCKVFITISPLNHLTINLLLTVMIVERFVTVYHSTPFLRYRSSFIAKFICLAVWAVSTLLMVPVYLYANILENGEPVWCDIYWPHNEYMEGLNAFHLYASILGFAIPLVFILLFYFLIICKLRTAEPKDHSEEREKSHRKVTRLVVTIITVDVICFLPYWITLVCEAFQPHSQDPTYLLIIYMNLSRCLPYASAAINPILYAFHSDDFKKSFAKAFK